MVSGKALRCRIKDGSEKGKEGYFYGKFCIDGDNTWWALIMFDGEYVLALRHSQHVEVAANFVSVDEWE